ncbi:MAG: glycogen/starch/alpha-glucan phosphorylase [Chlamydiota bacterium]|nr:glycogen/starch/alpha-glucan phosphorylase [Chlamydiota bacterium]
MIKRFITSHQSITGAAIILGGASFLSRIIGIVRDRIFAHQFGAGDVLDAYYAAFRIPDLVYNLLIVGALSAGFIPIFLELKEKNKTEFASYIKETMDIIIDTNSIFDVQVKRMHEYKRQLLFGLYIISQYLTIKNKLSEFIHPRTFFVGGKAAPGYAMAKLIIKFLNNIAFRINLDKRINDKIKLIFLENYRVSLAEKVFPASDLSEQISTSGTEASGTGNMKFMLNGALTIGTLDGANVEIADAVGSENIFIFGNTVSEIDKLKAHGYNPTDYIKCSPMLGEIIHLIRDNFFSQYTPGLFNPILESLCNSDPYFICADFEPYCKMQDIVSRTYLEKEEWTKKSIINVSKAGRFSSDRTIREYAKEIWKV